MEFAKCSPRNPDALSLDSTCCSSSSTDDSSEVLDMTVEYHRGAGAHDALSENDRPFSLQAYQSTTQTTRLKSAMRRDGLRAEKRGVAVSFSQDVIVRLYGEKSPKQSRWLSPSDLKRIRGENSRSVMVLRLLQKHISDPIMTKYISQRGSSTIGENTPIGVEHYLQRGCISQINERRVRIRHAVFRAQETEVEGPEALASLCRQLSRPSQQRAEVLGRLHSRGI